MINPFSKRKTKRHAKVLEDHFWDCSVCTYRNTAEAFKCLMCDIRKGTSTRKPRINPQLVAQQVAQQYSPTPPKTNKKEGVFKEGSGGKESAAKEKPEKKNSGPENKSVKKSWYPPRLKNVDRSTAQTREVTVNNVTVFITEYKPKLKKNGSDESGQSSSASSENGSQSESSTDARSVDIGADSRSS
ncbi:RING1 and YY1-binding protein isoform X2 [Anabrus simplex]|uniref:RING1 and YY1-binding protein isoform X2 n=1 Tax=Anabrus simplex TaxID=316456 RepID=UPI0034DD6A8B